MKTHEPTTASAKALRPTRRQLVRNAGFALAAALLPRAKRRRRAPSPTLPRDAAEAPLWIGHF